MPRNLLKLCTLFLFPAAALAQVAPPTTAPKPPALPELNIAPPLPDKPQKTLEFPLGEGVGRGAPILVPITIAGKEHLFVADTGCSHTVIDSTLTQNLKETLGAPIGKVNIDTLQGPKTQSARYRPPTFEAGGQRLKNQGTYIMTVDMELLRQASGRPVEGILGWDVLSQYVVRLDFRRRVLELIDPAGFQMPNDIAAKAFQITETLDTPSILIPLAGVPDVLVTIDTGYSAFGTMTLGVLAKVPPAEVVESTTHAVADASGNVEVKDLSIKRKWSVGGTTFENSPFQLASFNVLGLRALADFVVTIDFPHNHVYLESIRPQHPPELPELEFGIALKDGRIIVHNLNDGAKNLDIQPGDQILSVDGKDIPKTELWALREQLQKAKSPVISLQRNNQTHDITIHHD